MTAPTYPDIAAFLVANLDRLADERTHMRMILPGKVTCICGEQGQIESGSDEGWTVSHYNDPRMEHRITRLDEMTQFVEQFPLSADAKWFIADIAAKRAIVAEYVRSRESTKVGEVSGQIAWADAAYLLAVPFADQPGYRPEWAVG